MPFPKKFRGIFNELETVPEAYGDFVKTFDSVSFKFDPSAMSDSRQRALYDTPSIRERGYLRM